MNRVRKTLHTSVPPMDFNFNYLAPMRTQYENLLEATINLIDICQNLRHSLEDRERKILK